jgi:ubiquinone/menaquinone biosynthesis C-methylase UbiE
VDHLFEGLEEGGYNAFQERVQEADVSTLHWVAAQLMNPTMDSPQGERMLQAMSKTNIFSGSQLVATVNGVLNGSTPNARILEIGCGSGQTFKQMARVCRARGRDWKLMGIDQSMDSIRFARMKLEDAGADPAVYQLQVADIDNGLWSFQDDSFDVVYHLNCWYFWKNVDKGVAETFRVLKPGGTLITGSKLSPIYDLFGPRFPEVSNHFPVLESKRGPRAEHRDLRAYEEALGRNGFANVVSVDVMPPGGEDGDNFLDAFTLTTARIPES